jgi:hypothetical protein
LRALEIADRVLAAAENADLIAVVADALITKGSALCDLGRSYEGLGALRTGLEMARSGELPMTGLRALANIAATQTSRDPVAAVDASREGLVDARRLSLGIVISLIGNLAEAVQWTGDWSWVIDEAQVLLETDLDRGDRAFLIRSILPLRSWQGDAVEDELEEVDRLVIGLEDPQTVGLIHFARSQVALATGLLDEARNEAWECARLHAANAPLAYATAARAALWSENPAPARSDLAALENTHAHGPAISLHKATMQAGIAAVEGRSADALGGYRDALRGSRDGGLPVLEALTAIDMATLLDPGLPEVQAAAETAREVFGRLGAGPFLDRLESALDREASHAAKVGMRLAATMDART